MYLTLTYTNWNILVICRQKKKDFVDRKKKLMIQFLHLWQLHKQLLYASLLSDAECDTLKDKITFILSIIGFEEDFRIVRRRELICWFEDTYVGASLAFHLLQWIIGYRIWEAGLGELRERKGVGTYGR